MNSFLDTQEAWGVLIHEGQDRFRVPVVRGNTGSGDSDPALPPALSAVRPWAW